MATPKNGTIALDETSALMNMDTTFDDVLPAPQAVSLVEFIEETVEEDGVKRTRRRPIRRVAYINTYVPMKILHTMMASQERLRQLQGMQKEAKDGTLSTGNQQLMMEWMSAQVTAVWQLTEPDMTADKLAEGLSFQKVFGLFRIFFGDLLSSMNQQKLP